MVMSKCVHSTRMRLINAEASEGGLRGQTCVMEMAFTSSCSRRKLLACSSVIG